MDQLMERIAAVVPSLDGWCTVEKAKWLAHWIVEKKCREIVEIGVFGGSSLIPMAMAVDYLFRDDRYFLGHVIGLDPYSNDTAETNDLDEANKKWWKEVDLEAVYKKMQEAVIRNRVGHVVTILLLQSQDGALKFADTSLDLVHVDGSHNEVNSTQDVKLWWPKLKPGGIMVMDDTHWKQLVAARHLIGTLGKLIHYSETWEVYQK